MSQVNLTSAETFSHKSKAEAYVIITTGAGEESKALEKLDDMEEVKEAYLVSGSFDILIRLQADDMGRLRELVKQRILRLDEVRRIRVLLRG
ncbi:Lrp/AsnC family transcriptional regulator [Candidatus Bathyarchaeota archaeon]|jgi:DNA-binding Lrp family transcriptional regulator|nr:Lrp/AsnC family transcriptional regulator [Candidatus Bathyarchaeota archaeon]